MCHHDIMRCRHVGKRAPPTHFISKHTSPYSAFNVCINSPSPFNFPHPRLEAPYYLQLKKHKSLAWEKGGIVSTMVFTPRPITRWTQGPHHEMAKAHYHIKTRRELTRRESLKGHLRKPGYPVKDSLHGGPS